MDYHSLLQSATASGIDVYEKVLSLKTKGLYGDNVIWINQTLSSVEKTCTLAEELGHHFTTYGNILDQSKLINRKQELRAREWGYKLLFPLEKLIEAQKIGIRSRFELADYLNVTEQFLEDSLKRYKEKYGLYKKIGKFTICFDPLGIVESFEEVMPK
ncbi:ImmA/IrrE family metallo-endopeptidase [Bacillus sp. SIMBA_005]|uniref:ImmA/IrrE family metallo-endopeptidase n=1 Tax=Bacillus sp. SIMBA_005 TaxID=3085754 RepID=UPI0039795F25